MPDEEEKNVIDSKHQYALLTAAIGGDALASMACVVGMKSIFDYHKPMDHKDAMTTPDAEEWAKNEG